MLTIKPKTRKEIYLAYLSGDMSLELPEPLTRDEVNLYNLCKNKAYGEYTTVKEVLAECQPEFNADVGSFAFDSAPDLAIGEKYIVKWNGVEHTCVAQDFDGMTVVGNTGNAPDGVNTGEPFVFAVVSADVAAEFGYAALATPLDGSTTLTISIRQEVTEVKKISGKYVEGMGWSETGEMVLVDNFPVEPNLSPNDAVLPNLVLTIGEVYTVIYDGVRYENLVCFDDGGHPAIGAPYEEVGPNFEFCIYFDDGKTHCARYSIGGTNFVTVIGMGETIHPIDQKFLPSGGNGGGGGVHAFIEKQGNEYALYLETAYDGAFVPHMALSNGFDTFLADGASISKMMSAYPADDGTIVMAFVDAKTGKVLRLAYDENNGTIEVVDAVS